MSETRDLETDNAHRTVSQFIEEVRQARKAGWDWKQVPEELLEVLQQTTVPHALSLMKEFVK